MDYNAKDPNLCLEVNFTVYRTCRISKNALRALSILVISSFLAYLFYRKNDPRYLNDDTSSSHSMFDGECKGRADFRFIRVEFEARFAA